MNETLSLDGNWHVVYDHDNTGRLLNLQQPENFYCREDLEEITVPACLEEFKQDYEGVAWYGKTFTCPANWADKTGRIYFAAVNYRAEIWLNGEAVGAHEGGYIGFELHIDDLLREGDNFIAVRVITPLILRDVVIDGLGRDDMPHWRGAIAGGIWQSVGLVATGSVYIEDTFVTADINSGEVRTTHTLQNKGLRRAEAEIAWTITPFKGETPVASGRDVATLNPGSSIHEQICTIKNHKLWQLDEPNLYIVTTTIGLRGALSDRRETRFGFREFTANGKNFYLNGEKIILKTTFNEAFYPHSLAYPRDLELLKKEFALIKEGNINMIRPWRKPQPQVVYDLADEMGVLFVGALPVECMANWPQITPYTRQRIENEAVEMVKRDRNHPSIVIWEMFNEIMRDGLKRLKHGVSLKARELDHTRMIIDEAGGFADGCSVYLPGSYEPITINDVHQYPGMPMAQESYDQLLALGKSEEESREMGRTMNQVGGSKIEPGLLTNISELGYGSIPDLEANFCRYQKEGNPLTPDYRMHQRLRDSYLAVFAKTGTDQVFADFHAFVEACQEIHYTGNKLMTEACRINPDIGGIGIHALNDGDWVLGAGLIDNFRNPKRPYYAIKEVFAERYMAIRPDVQNVYAGQPVEIALTAVNDKEPLAGTLSLRIVADDGRTVLEYDEETTMSNGIAGLGTHVLDTAGIEGPCRIECCFKADGVPSIKNETSVYVLDPGKGQLSDRPLALIDMDGGLGKHLPNAVPFSQQTPKDQLALVNLNGWNGEPDTRFAVLAQWVAGGGTALFLNLPPQAPFKKSGNRMYRHVAQDTILPFALDLYTGKGLWTPCSHVVKEHPFFDGLPANCLMGQEYRDIVPRWSIVNPECDWIGGNITYDWYSGLKHKQNYIGVSEAFHGADLAPIAHGKGTYILCTYRIVENLAKDPIADRLLRNMLTAA
ncbi:MAG: hypothetical protein GKR89_14530 [Candidatus Latescibacteria bacterium]|nr:hypothetical protein [Candidatus Latescibacterota bacterium]